MYSLLVLLFVFSSLFLSTGCLQTYFPAYKLVEFIAIARNAVAPKDSAWRQDVYDKSLRARGHLAGGIDMALDRKLAAAIFQCCVTVLCSSISHGQVALCWSHSDCTLNQRRLNGRLRARSHAPHGMQWRHIFTRRTRHPFSLPVIATKGPHVSLHVFPTLGNEVLHKLAGEWYQHPLCKGAH